MNDLVDIGANLTHESFTDDRNEVITNAARAGVRRLIVTGASIEGSHKALQLAREQPNTLFATAGIHPHHASDYDPEADRVLRNLAADHSIVAIGECGLDYFRNFSPVEAQLAAFEAQLKIAVDIQKPVFLHQRDAHDAFLDVLRRYIDQIPGGVAHCFTGGIQELEAYLELGLHIGVTGWICDERRGSKLQQTVSRIPLNRILLETDAPYLLPRDLKHPPSGRRNVPELLPHILEVVAHHMDIQADQLAHAATHNSEQLFSLV